MAENLRSAPKITTEVRESAIYRSLGAGLTDAIFLLGHADGLTLNDPYLVTSLRDAITRLGGSASTSPLTKALLEAYYAGARDIWLVAVAPMSEYQPDITLRNQAYYQQYAARLDTTYEILKDWNVADITVPIDAPFNSTVDFLGPLAIYCLEAFYRSGNIHMGILGSRGQITSAHVPVLLGDKRPQSLGDAGKYVSVYLGDGLFNFRERPASHTSSLAAVVAATISQLPLDRGMTYQKLRNVSSLSGPHLSKAEIQSLSNAKFNVCGPTVMGRRGQPFEIVSYTDNTMALEGSDYWSLVQMRLVARVSEVISGMGRSRLGTIGYPLFKDEVNGYLISLVGKNVIRSFDINIARHEYDLNKVLVDLSLTPFNGVREVHVSLTVGSTE